MSDIDREELKFHGSCDTQNTNEITALLLLPYFDHGHNTWSWSTSTRCFYMAAMHPNTWRQGSCDVKDKLGICEEMFGEYLSRCIVCCSKTVNAYLIVSPTYVLTNLEISF